MATNPDFRPAHVPQERVVDFDIYHPPGAKDDFHGAWKALQDRGLADLVWTPHQGGHWIATRNAMLHEILGDHERFANTASILPKSAYGDIGLLPVTLDPPAHRPFRLLLNAGFSPRVIRSAEPGIRALAGELIDAMRPAGKGDFISGYSTQFPVLVFLRMADLPIADAPMLKHWSDQMLRPDPAADWGEDVSGWRHGIRRFREYLEPHVLERRGSDRQDLLSHIINGDIDGRPVSHDEALQLTVQVVLAGLDTVVNFLGFAMLHLAQHPEQQAYLVANPAIMPSAVEELLRRYAIVTMAREVRQDTVLDGVELKAGDMIATPTMLGGIDDRANRCPMSVEFDRANPEHATFGNGPHKCPGAFLARTEIQITLEEWLSRIPTFAVAPGHKVRFSPGGVAVVDELPLVWPV